MDFSTLYLHIVANLATIYPYCCTFSENSIFLDTKIIKTPFSNSIDKEFEENENGDFLDL